MPYEDEPPLHEEGESDNLAPIDVIAASEFAQQLDYARTHPRSLAKWKRRALELATFDEVVAASCFYALPRRQKNADGKYENVIIKGPSARFAEIVVSTWGNCRAGARVAGEDASGEFVRGQGTFHDLETNFHCGFEITRRITSASGQKYSADMIQVTGNAAASIAYRNAALKGIPGALWKPIFEIAQRAAVGNIQSLKKKREEIISIFNKMGIPTDVIFLVAGIKGIDDIDGDILIFLRGLETAIRDSDTNVETILRDWSREQPQDASPGMNRGANRVAEAVERAKATVTKAGTGEGAPGPDGGTQAAATAPPAAEQKERPPQGSSTAKGDGSLFSGDGSEKGKQKK